MVTRIGREHSGRREAGSPKGGEAASPKSSVSDLEKQGGTGSDEGNALSTLDLHGARVSFFLDNKREKGDFYGGAK